MIPRLDARALARGDAEATRALARAASETGFFTLAHTAIAPDEVERLIAVYGAFFHLPEAEKRRIDMALTGSNRGWGAPGGERVDPASNPDLKEVFDMGFELDADDPLARHGLKYYAPNLWPEAPEGFREAVEGYYRQALGVALELLGSVAVAVGQPRDSFAKAFDRPMALLRANFYPARPDWAGERDFGIAPHTDYGCLTLLATDGSAGLEVQRRDGSWAPVSAPPGEFVINFGEMLEMWSGGRIKATPHRVIGTTAERISIPLFFNPRYDADVSAPGQPTRLAGDHLSRRYDETYLHLAGTPGR